MEFTDEEKDVIVQSFVENPRNLLSEEELREQLHVAITYFTNADNDKVDPKQSSALPHIIHD